MFSARAQIGCGRPSASSVWASYFSPAPELLFSLTSCCRDLTRWPSYLWREGALHSHQVSILLCGYEKWVRCIHVSQYMCLFPCWDWTSLHQRSYNLTVPACRGGNLTINSAATPIDVPPSIWVPIIANSLYNHGCIIKSLLYPSPPWYNWRRYPISKCNNNRVASMISPDCV